MAPTRKTSRPPASATRSKNRDTTSQGIRKDERGQAQPADKRRALKNR